MSKKKIVFATHNAHKCQEINIMIGDKYEIVPLDAVGINEDIEENGTTFWENALIKAKYVYDKLGLDCFADDSGLIANALGDEPGIFSARYAGEPTDMERNIEKLLSRLDSHSDRGARFHTSIAAIINGQTYYFDGVINGVIIKEKRGSNGFGYDPVFIPDGYTQTFAELDSATKNTISHRAKAVARLVDFLQKNQ